MDSFFDILGNRELSYTKAFDQAVFKLLAGIGTKLSLIPYGTGVLDAIAPEGIPNSPRSYTLIRIISNKEPYDERELQQELEDLCDAFECKSPIILIITDECDDGPIHECVTSTEIRCNIDIWSREYIESIFSGEQPRRRDRIRVAVNEESFLRWLVKHMIELEYSVGHDDASEIRSLMNRVHLNRMIRKAREKRIVLFLGAGVTIDSNGPSWRELISQLRIRFLQGNPKSGSVEAQILEKVSKSLSLKQQSIPLIAALELESVFGDDFLNEISKIIYNDDIRIGCTLTSISKLCQEKLISAVVTYNWDSLLEQALESAGVSYKVITEDSDRYRPDELPIYHVHGFLPNRLIFPDMIREPHVVFSEEKYHILYRDPYHWANHIQLNFLRDYVCVFIGLSMTDPNQRRLMQIAASRHHDPEHIVFRQWYSEEEIKKELKCPICRENYCASCREPDIDENKLETIVRVHHLIEGRALMDSLKTNVVWYNRHDETPFYLDCIENNSSTNT